jgi:hypothetical protein
LLRRHGFGGAAPAAMDELEANRWIVESPDRPGVELKGWERWQASKRSDYLKEWRARPSRGGTKPRDTVSIQSRTISSHVPYRTDPGGGPTEGVWGNQDQEGEPVWDKRIEGLYRREIEQQPTDEVYEDRSTERPEPDPSVRSMDDLRAVMARIKEKAPPAPNHPKRRGGTPD